MVSLPISVMFLVLTHFSCFCPSISIWDDVSPRHCSETIQSMERSAFRTLKRNLFIIVTKWAVNSLINVLPKKVSVCKLIKSKYGINLKKKKAEEEEHAPSSHWSYPKSVNHNLVEVIKELQVQCQLTGCGSQWFIHSCNSNSNQCRRHSSLSLRIGCFSPHWVNCCDSSRVSSHLICSCRI